MTLPTGNGVSLGNCFHDYLHCNTDNCPVLIFVAFCASSAYTSCAASLTFPVFLSSSDCSLASRLPLVSLRCRLTIIKLESTFTVDPPVLEYMRRNQLYGFGRQRRKIVKDSVLTRRLLVASAVGVVFAIGMTAVVVGSRQKGGQGRG